MSWLMEIGQTELNVGPKPSLRSPIKQALAFSDLSQVVAFPYKLTAQSQLV